MHIITLPRMVALAGALAVAWGAGSCAGDPTGPPPDDAIIVAFDQSLDQWPDDDWDFQDAAVVGDSLALGIGYGGGCADHDLHLLAVTGFAQRLELVAPGSPLPAALVPLFLSHDAHDDPCEAYITRTLRFDLRPLRAEFRRQFGDGPGRIILRVPTGQGSADSVSIDFTFD